MHVDPWEWILLGAIVVGLIAVDLVGHVRNAHEPTLGEAARWTTFYVSLAIVFGVLTYVRHGGQFATEYFAGYLTEYSLSLDNIFVFIIIIAAFRVPRIYQQKVLLYGIVIALILRLIFILIGAKLIEQFIAVFFVFGAWMLYTAVKQVIDGIQEGRKRKTNELDDDEYSPTFVTRLISRVANVTDGYVGDRLVLRRQGKTWITPLMLCIVSIGTIDLMFALDSIPAIFGLTKEPFIVFAANAFALLGLRQLFFLVDGLLERLIYLHYGLAVILGFIALKLLVHAFHGYDMLMFIPEPSIGVSVGVILGTILITVAASVYGSRKYENLKTPADRVAKIEPLEEHKPSIGD
ncbi:TerC/Alx family metal homeostasis membrane protein [Trueperella pecoris]|uniref:TerC/Alx family metal homeostasis membrane protein n=1 Tax=Trueperella pecoris TaxID=2733571 RepID=UPI00186B96EE|nr:TerC/Alx family metal homeostasis membrane protein [Trueperella pecoris]QOQ39860.1 TerC/Alx family metal homeostasis membrane protein [Trueperella pecoris]